MLCFDVRLNGEMVARAGVPGGVLTAILTAVHNPSGRSPELMLEIGGYVQETHLNWAQPPVRAGDRIEIRIVDAENADPPVHEHRESQAQREESERQYYERLKQKYEP